MYYNLSTYDSRQKFGHDHLGKQSYGQERQIHQYDLNEDEEEDLDNFVDQVNNSKITAKTGASGKVKVSDFLRGRQDNAGPTKNQPMGLFEFSGHHRNPVRSGISPYKQPKHSGPPLGGGGPGGGPTPPPYSHPYAGGPSGGGPMPPPMSGGPGGPGGPGIPETPWGPGSPFGPTGPSGPGEF